MSGRWAGSSRAERLPPDWPQLRAEVERRAAGRCEALEHAAGCHGIGAECDHIIAGDNHQLDNLQWLSGPCHAAKTQREARAARARNARRRPRTEPHPGRITR